MSRPSTAGSGRSPAGGAPGLLGPERPPSPSRTKAYRRASKAWAAARGSNPASGPTAAQRVQEARTKAAVAGRSLGAQSPPPTAERWEAPECGWRQYSGPGADGAARVVAVRSRFAEEEGLRAVAHEIEENNASLHVYDPEDHMAGSGAGGFDDAGFAKTRGISIFVQLPFGTTATLNDLPADLTVRDLKALLVAVEQRCVAKQAAAAAAARRAPSSAGGAAAPRSHADVAVATAPPKLRPSDLSLAYNGKPMRDGHGLAVYNLHDLSTVFATLRLLGGASTAEEMFESLRGGVQCSWKRPQMISESTGEFFDSWDAYNDKDTRFAWRKKGAKSWGVPDGATGKNVSMFHHVLTKDFIGRKVGWLSTQTHRCYVDERFPILTSPKGGPVSFEAMGETQAVPSHQTQRHTAGTAAMASPGGGDFKMTLSKKEAHDGGGGWEEEKSSE